MLAKQYLYLVLMRLFSYKHLHLQALLQYFFASTWRLYGLPTENVKT